MRIVKLTALLACLLATACILATIAGCASGRDDELARERAETLRRQREIERQMREKLRLEALRKTQEEITGKKAEEEVWQEYLKVADTLKASSQPISAIAISPDGRLLACGTARGQLKVFEIGGGIKTAATEHNEAIRAISFSPDSSVLYTGGADETLTIWDMTSGKAKKKIHDFFLTVGAIAVSADGGTIAVGDGKRIFLLDDMGAARKELKSKAYGVRAVRFIPESGKMAAGSRGGLVEIWDTAADRPAHSAQRHTGAVTCLTVDSQGKTMLSGGTNRLVVLWNVQTVKPMRVYEGHHNAITGVIFVPGKKNFVSSDNGGWLFVWDIDTSKILSKMQVCKTAAVTCLVLSPDGKRLYAALGDGTVAVLEFATDK